ncbi:MAG: hypothetical protein U9R08_00245 [Nanoarchaeota archaeon]|nr:hypothetical protein [Nanoarchaeota archaeon]
MKKGIIMLSLLTIVFLSVGCMFDIADYIPFSGNSYSSSSNSQPDRELARPDLVNNNVDVSEPLCEPHGYFDGNKCICDAGYVSDGKDCIPGNRKCIYDKDCGKSICDGNIMFVPRCDLRTYKCVGMEMVSCKGVYGDDYVCRSGSCVKD